ncbi:hypothetical protein KR222_000135, partial [Zaprionus bogoriensis]
MLRNPIAQVFISFMLGYYATTKISQFCGLVSKMIDKGDSESECTTRPANDCRDEQAPKADSDETQDVALRLTRRQLTAYDGLHDNRPIYTALNGKIYDVTPAREKFSMPGLYALLAGCNANQVLNIACGSMGLCTADLVQRWERSLSAEYNMIGYLIDSD